ncbi:hypothetical protein JCM19237_6434 [Photobacterium aphoticum]|uniref:Uncharacterized protein n=1 Tax=Photobacterium aphoticum TaxID=754436 RepID=A0A090QK94_9GAMM|nr:hypothetical protein JCM19237_6434 [Photobacterium aphoticum]
MQWQTRWKTEKNHPDTVGHYSGDNTRFARFRRPVATLADRNLA